MLNSFNAAEGLEQQNKSNNNFTIYNSNSKTEIQKLENYKIEIKELTETIRLNPNDFRLYFNRATLKLHAGDIEGARSDFRMAEDYHSQNNFELEDFPLL